MRITLKAKTPSQTNNVITLSVYLVNPLGIVIFDDSKNITLTQTGIVEAFEAIFTYSLPETALIGYYKVYVQASAERLKTHSFITAIARAALGPTTIKATVQAKGYKTSQHQLSYDNTNIVTLYASIPLGLIILTVILKHGKEKD